MQVADITEQQRQEIHSALIERRDSLDKLAESSEKKHAPHAAEALRDLLALYRDNTSESGDAKITTPGLISMFAPQPSLWEQQEKAGEARDPEGQQDIFGGGSETGGGIPAGGVAKWDPAAVAAQRNGGSTEEELADPRTEPETRDSHLIGGSSSSDEQGTESPTEPSTDQETLDYREEFTESEPTQDAGKWSDAPAVDPEMPAAPPEQAEFS